MAEVESWYTLWSIGLSENQYPEVIESSFNEAENIPGVDRTQTALSMFGFYGALDNNSIGGFVVSGVGDSLSAESVTIRLDQYVYSCSQIKFFGKEIGDGFFLRGDIGPAKIALRLMETLKH